MQETKKIRVLMSKPGIDGHWRGGIVVSRALRDAGMELIFGGFQNIEQIVESAVQEDVDIIGLSIHSGAHIAYTKQLIDLLEEKGLKDNFMIHNEHRNKEMIARIINEAIDGNTCLVLVDRLDQARSLSLSMGQKLANFAWGEDSAEERNRKFSEFRSGEIPVLVCTHQLVGEGFDVKNINRLFLMWGGKTDRQTFQAIGRVMRKSKYKTAILYDVVDPIAPFSQHFLERLEVYQSEEAFQLEDDGNTLPRWARNYLW